MLNREKFAEEILDIACTGSGLALDKRTNKLVTCDGLSCVNCGFRYATSEKSCRFYCKEWCNSEYTEPEVDWSKIPIDTPVLVKNRKENIWCNRYFAYYEDGKFFTYANGGTSWSSNNSTIPWELCKLAREEDKILYSKNQNE